MAYSNPEKYVKIYAYETGIRRWDVLGTDGYNPNIIKPGFKSKELAEAWMRVYLERYVKLHMMDSLTEADYEPLDK